MSDMIERVTDAIRLDDGSPCISTLKLSRCKHADGCVCRSLACAAIEAMREPTTAMTAKACNALKRHISSFTESERAARSGWKRDDNGWRVPNKEKHRVRYAAMIDAALKPEVQP